MKDEKESAPARKVSRDKLELLSLLLEEEDEGFERIETIKPREDGGEMPLSYAQRRMWFLWRLAPDSPAYHIAGALALRGRLDAGALSRSLAEVVRRHESLRSTFETVGGHPLQRVTPPAPFALHAEDLSGHGAGEREAEALRLAREEARRPFDLESGPLLRARLLRLSDDEHLLTLTMHHIVSDGWSIGVLLDELTRLYAAFASGRESPLEELPVQYADYAAWQRRHLEGGGELTRQLAYWRERLAGAPALELPTDRPRRAERGQEGGRVALRLGAGLSAGVREAARREGVTPFMLLLAAFQVLLHRYTGQEDISVGTPVAGRNRSEVEGLIGFFVNTLVLRTDLSGDPSFQELLARVRETAVGAYAHQDVPFEKLVEELRPERNLSRTPLFQVMFMLHQAQPETWRLPSLELSLVRAEGTSAKFDVTLTAVERAEEFSFELEYSTELFNEETARRLLGHYELLLGGVVADPAARVSQLTILTDAEQRRLAEWNDTAAPYPRESSLHQLFEEQAARTPDAVAVVYEGRRLTYAELNARANALAHHLLALGVGPEVRVGLCVERSPEMLAALLGILKAGGAYVPLDANYPRERLSFMLEDSAVSVLVTEARAAEKLPAHGARVVLLDADVPRSAGESTANPPGRGDARGLAYVLYTSGSTGRPKGVMISHASVVNFLRSMCRRPGLTGEDVLLSVTTLSFDIAALELFGPLVVGGRLVIAGSDAVSDAPRLIEMLADSGATVMQATPTTWRLLVDAGWRNGTRLRVLCGGEALSQELAARLLERTDSLWNLYGPTETTIWSAVHKVESAERPVPVGQPVANTRLNILDGSSNPVPVGVRGELCIGGDGLARGYLGRPGLTAERFVPDPFSGEAGARLYRTGDVCRWLADGTVEFVGRVDSQVKVRGHRVELGEVEAALREHDAVGECVVAIKGEGAESRLVAYVVAEGAGGGEAGAKALREHLRARLPPHMIPSAFVALERLPLTANGKIDRKALPEPGESAADPAAAYAAPRSETERTIAAVWREALGVERVGVEDNFFDLGGHSLLLARVHARLREGFARPLAMLDMFKYPTVAALAEYLSGGEGEGDSVREVGERFAGREAAAGLKAEAVAVVGMSCRLPGAASVEEFWKNLRGGVESITFFSDEELLAAGIDPAVLENPNYVKACATLDGVELFDAAFFGYSPREAEIIDPQQRLFLECASEALERAALNPDKYEGLVGVYAGVGFNSYLMNNLYPNREALGALGNFQAIIGNDKDFISTRVSYELNLAGPSMTVQTACSSSLVAVHLACRSLLAGECDAALAGGASVRVPQQSGYLYQEGGKNSPDGHCRAFDAKAQGIVEGNGVGVVVLKRLSDALADGDVIHAVIRGTAVNNDGSRKVGFTAPGVEGQAKVVRAAHLAAGVEPETISYVEAHGTGTALGDPVEIEALTQAFRAATDGKGFCAVGSVKTNIGHADVAAGVAGLIKAVLSLRHGEIPPTLHYERANPRIDFASSPFYVNAGLSEWRRGADGGPRRAGVSSFGIGGTNAHVVLEEAVERGVSDAPWRGWQLLAVSAKTEAALEAATDNLAAYLRQHREVPLADIAYTLQVGRRSFEHRRVLVCRDAGEAAAALETAEAGRVLTYRQEGGARGVAFMFPGGGAQHVRMGRELYEREAVFREEFDRCAELLHTESGLDLRAVVYAEAEGGEALEETLAARMERPSLALPALFAVEYALAKLWMSWGVRPEAMIGHSLGEYVAACLSGVFTLEDALALVVLRGRLFEKLPRGAMLSIALGEDEVRPLLTDGLSLAAVNAPRLCVVSGPEASVAAASARLEAEGVEVRRLRIDVAAHSEMLAGILDEFGRFVARLEKRRPEIPFVSNVTGRWITAEEATSGDYWVRHLRQTVRFAEGLAELSRARRPILLEVGPGQTLSTLARQQQGSGANAWVVPSLRRPNEPQSDEFTMLSALGRLWLAGVDVVWAKTYGAGERRLRVELPTYPFERRRFWIESKGRPFGAARERDDAPADAAAAGGPATPAQPALHSRPNLLTPYVAPGDELERRIAGLWQELLGIEQIGIHDNFFELGGHSLLATRLLSRVTSTFAVEMSLPSLFEEPTIKRLAEEVRRRQQEQKVAPAGGIVRGAAAEEVLSDLEGLSGEEVRQLLGSILAKTEIDR